MNRRDFIKYMSVTPAVAAASKVLADIKESYDPIGKLSVEKSNIINQTNNSTLVITKNMIIRYTLTSKPNFSIHGIDVIQGIKEISFEASVFPNFEFDWVGNYDSFVLNFGPTDIINRKFIISEISISEQTGGPMAIDISGLYVSGS